VGSYDVDTSASAQMPMTFTAIDLLGHQEEEEENNGASYGLWHNSSAQSLGILDFAHTMTPVSSPIELGGLEGCSQRNPPPG